MHDDMHATHHNQMLRSVAPNHRYTINLQLRELASFSVDPWPAVTRVLFTPADLDARR